MIRKKNLENQSGFGPELYASFLKVREQGLGLLTSGWIAGGAIRHELAKRFGNTQDTTGDFDCYFTSKEALEETKNRIFSRPILKPEVLAEDAQVLSLQTSIGKVDLVKQYFYSPRECLDSFDFSVCRFAISTENVCYWEEDGLEHLVEKKLVILNACRPFQTMLRVQKYITKGYWMELDQSKFLAEQLRTMPDSDLVKTHARLSAKADLY